jgi:hypothetical protein
LAEFLRSGHTPNEAGLDGSDPTTSNEDSGQGELVSRFFGEEAVDSDSDWDSEDDEDVPG